MRTVFLMLIVVITVGLGVAAAQSADEAAINELIEGYWAASAAGDAAAGAAYFTENGVLALRIGVAVGRANIEQMSSQLVAGGAVPGAGEVIPGGVEINFSPTIRLVSPTTAIVYGLYNTPSATPPIKGHMTMTVVKEGNEWLIAAQQTGAAPPEQ